MSEPITDEELSKLRAWKKEYDEGEPIRIAREHELRADKARLDWLQSQWRVTSFIPNGEFLADHLRASIDDAMMRTIDYTPKCP